MQGGLFAGLRARLLWVVALAMLPVLLFGIYLLHEQSAAAAAAARENALRIARLGVSRFNALHHSSERWLTVLARLPEARRTGPACRQIYADLLAQRPMYRDLGLARPDGAVACSATSRTAPLDPALLATAGEDRPFRASTYRLEHGSPTVTFVRRLGDHRFLYATIGSDWLHALANEALLPADSTLTLVDGEGRVLARYPSEAGWLNRLFPQMPGLLEARRDGAEGMGEGPGMDGVHRFYALSALNENGTGSRVFVAVGVSEQAAFAVVSELRAQSLAAAVVMALLVLVGAGLGLDRVVLRPVGGLLAATRRVTAGDLAARAAVTHSGDEMAQLARDFNDMAVAIAQREASSRRAQQALEQSEARFRRLAENAPDLIYRYRLDPTPAFDYVSPAVTRITGYTPEEHYADPSLAGRLVHPDDRPLLERMLAAEEPGSVELRWVRRDSVVVWIEQRYVPIADSDGRRRAIEGIARDITERKRKEQELSLLQSITEAVSEAADVEAGLAIVLREVCRATGWVLGQAWIPQPGGQVMHCSAAWYGEGSGLDAYRAASESWSVRTGSPGLVARAWGSRTALWVRDIREDRSFRRAEEALRAGLGAVIALPVLSGSDVEAVIEFYMQSVRPEDEALARTVLGAAAQFGSVIRRKRSEERLHHLAHHDVLTGLPNRTLFGDRLAQALADAQRRERLTAVAFLDLDGFKTINDSLGHEAGDLLLKEAALRLRACLRDSDTVARVSGDEFTLVLADLAHVDDAARIAEKILDRLRKPFWVAGRELYVTASLGLTVYPFDDRDPDGLLRNADVAMYRAKDQGRNTYQFYAAEMTARARERLDLEGALRRALERDEFELHYQPIVDLRRGAVVGVEALLRWRHPERGLVPPCQFVPLAEETGLILPIGDWVLRTACRQCRAWDDAGLGPLHLAVNISARQFQGTDLAGLVARHLSETGFPAERLELELTETLLMHNIEATIDTMKRLNDMGVQLSIDDFGTGYSSLTYLKRLPIDRLKIDRSFVRDIPSDPDDAALATAIIAIAHRLDITVIAEGVESEAQLTFLRAHGCDIMQGFYFGAPVDAASLAALIAANASLPGLKARSRGLRR